MRNWFVFLGFDLDWYDFISSCFESPFMLDQVNFILITEDEIFVEFL
jgi:hypothetical protein